MGYLILKKISKIFEDIIAVNYVDLTIGELKIFSKLTGITIAEDRVENTIKDVNRINQSFVEIDISALGNIDPAFTLKL